MPTLLLTVLTFAVITGYHFIPRDGDPMVAVFQSPQEDAALMNRLVAADASLLDWSDDRRVITIQSQTPGLARRMTDMGATFVLSAGVTSLCSLQELNSTFGQEEPV